MTETQTDSGTGPATTADEGVAATGDAVSSRLVAYLVDFALLSAVSFVLFLVAFGLMVAVGMASGSGSVGEFSAADVATTVVWLLLWAAVGLVVFGYFTYLDAGRGTFGKRFADVAVLSEDGTRPGMKATAGRTAVLLLPFPLMALLGTVAGAVGFLLAVPLMVGWLLVEASVLYFSGSHRRLGDRLANTVVVPAD